MKSKDILKFQDLSGKSISELFEEALGLKKKMMFMRLQKASGSSETTDTSYEKKNRRNFARIKTAIRQKSLKVGNK